MAAELFLEGIGRNKEFLRKNFCIIPLYEGVGTFLNVNLFNRYVGGVIRASTI